jgi:biopolymer transport protein TolQ
MQASVVASLNPWQIFLEATIVVKAVIVLLVLFFQVCLYIIIYKGIVLSRAISGSKRFIEIFWGSRSYDEVYEQSGRYTSSPVAQIFRAGYLELAKLKSGGRMEGGHAVVQEIGKRDLGEIEIVERSLNRAYTEELTRLEGMIPFLATTGSTAPFIGLFGTVWGIMHSFMNIKELNSVSLTTVAPGIAEALIATAIGLVAAVPAVIAYNYFLRKIRIVSASMSAFSNDFLNITKRHFLE